MSKRTNLKKTSKIKINILLIQSY